MVRQRHGALVGIIVAGLLTTIAWSPQALGDGGEPKTVLPDSLAFNPSPTGILVAPIVGTAAAPNALYVLYARYDAGAKSFPHTHTDQRVMTVLSGTFYAGSGPAFDEATLKPLGPGSVLIIPPDTLHYGWAKDGPVLVQEAGVGPSATKIWPKSDVK